MDSMATMELKETAEPVENMDYKGRFTDEYLQTKIRYEKLKKLNNQIEAAEMMDQKGPLHDCPSYLLKLQQRKMGEYLHILEIRAEIEGIEL